MSRATENRAHNDDREGQREEKQLPDLGELDKQAKAEAKETAAPAPPSKEFDPSR